MAILAFAAWGVPAHPGTFTHKQKDGSELSLQLIGDEYFSYYLNKTTGEKMERTSDGDFRVIGATELTARKKAGDERRSTANAARIARLPMMAQQGKVGGPKKAIGSYNTMTGTKKGLVILVNFADVALQASHTQAIFNDIFNQIGYNSNNHIGSVKDYFEAQSYGNFSIDFDVVGPVTVSKSMSYYGQNYGTNNSDRYPGAMVVEAVQLADSQCNVDFSLYDWDGNGEVDQVFVIYAGYGEAYQGSDPNTIWPHEWQLKYAGGGSVQTIDGVRINTYACTSELSGTSGSTLAGIGTACHEFSHCLGYPDLYDTDYSGGWGMDNFDLMAGGSYNGPNQNGEVPCGYSAYERWMAGWLTPVELTEPSTVSNMEAIGDSPEAYIIYNDNNRNEYLLLENRQNKNWFRYLYSITSAHGLFVSHIDYNSTSWAGNTVNDDPSHPRLTYIPADGVQSLDQYWNEVINDFFPGGSRVTELTATSHTDAWGKWFNRNKAGNYQFTNQDLTNITEASGKISFDFNGGAPEDDGTRYRITYYINGTMHNWVQSEFNEEFTFPTIPNSFTDWSPKGYSQTELTGISDNRDGIVEYTVGARIRPERDMTFYAIYGNEDNKFTSHPVEANFTITLKVKGSTAQQWSQTSSARRFTLPSITCTTAGWAFAGWCADEIGETTIEPTMLAAGTSVLPTADATYFAVFRQIVGTSGDGARYRLVDEPADGKRYVLATANAAGQAYAIDASKVPSSASASMSGASITIVNESGIAAIAAAGADLVWTASKAQGKLHLQNGDYYFKINGNGFSTSSSQSDLYWDNRYGLSGKSSSGSSTYYVYLDGSNLKTKQSTSTTNRIYLYEDITDGEIVYYNSNPSAIYHTVTFDAGSGSCDIAYFTQTDDVKSVNLPAATSGVSGWTFAGWSTEAVAQTSTAPTLLEAGTNYIPSGDETLYAVYTTTAYTGAIATTYYNSNPAEAMTNVFYTVTLRNGEGDGSTQIASWTQSAGNGTYTLPEATAPSGWTFFGWSESVVNQTPQQPTVLSGDTFTPTADVTFYSVFKNRKAYISNPSLYVAGGGTLDPQFYIPHIAYLGKPFAEPKFNSDSNGELFFSSSNPAVAEVDESTGKVTINAIGYTIITVQQAATATHKATSATYMIKVVAE